MKIKSITLYAVLLGVLCTVQAQDQKGYTNFQDIIFHFDEVSITGGAAKKSFRDETRCAGFISADIDQQFAVEGARKPGHPQYSGRCAFLARRTCTNLLRSVS